MIHWLTAFIDVPADRFPAATRFWAGATDATVSAPRGDRDQYVSLEPSDGHPHLALQSLDPEPRIHLDLHVDRFDEAVARSVELGAEIVAEPGHAILHSPGGFTFCIVTHGDHHDRGPRLSDPIEHRLDVLCIDVPAGAYEAECRFWSELTGRELWIGEEFPEFAGLALRHQGLPWNLLIQRLGDDDGGPRARAHLDVSSGDGFAAVVDAHVAIGAEVVRRFDNWTVLRDPAGLVYCITDRDPD